MDWQHAGGYEKIRADMTENRQYWKTQAHKDVEIVSKGEKTQSATYLLPPGISSWESGTRWTFSGSILSQTNHTMICNNPETLNYLVTAPRYEQSNIKDINTQPYEGILVNERYLCDPCFCCNIDSMMLPPAATWWCPREAELRWNSSGRASTAPCDTEWTGDSLLSPSTRSSMSATEDIGVNRPAIVWESPHFAFFPTFHNFWKNLPHFEHYLNKFGENHDHFCDARTFWAQKLCEN